MRPIKVIAWIVTGIFAVLFSIRIIALMSAESNAADTGTGYTFGYILGLLMGSAIVPGIFWLIVVLTKKKN